MSSFPVPLTPNLINKIVQGVTCTMTGLPPACVRLSWPTGGQPGFGIADDVVFISCVETDDYYNRVRDEEMVQVYPTTSLTADVLAGTDVSCPVGSSVGFLPNDTVTVDTGGNEEATTVVGMPPDALHIVLAQLKKTHITGAPVVDSQAADAHTVRYTRVWDIRWVVYGPNSFDNSRKLRSGLFTQAIHDALAFQNLYLVTDIAAPVRAPEYKDEQWWERVDFHAHYNEAVVEVDYVNVVESVEIKVYTDDPVTQPVADFTVTASNN